jgi:(p)ppGpp synthase/HD superfamily hydrolase
MARLTKRFEEALLFASRRHAKQKRKGTAVPYVSHLLAVSALVLENDGSEEEAIAALLHDAVEDRAATLDEIRDRFGTRVANIVWGCSDTDEHPKPPWKARKTAYIEHLKSAGRSQRLISAADKLHNARSILRDYRIEGDRVWDRFNADKTQTLWYYGAVGRDRCEDGAAATRPDQMPQGRAGPTVAPPPAERRRGSRHTGVSSCRCLRPGILSTRRPPPW